MPPTSFDIGLSLNPCPRKLGAPQKARNNRSRDGWIAELADEDVSFIKRFVLASGSLKELASVYGISYPTVRLRLDRLIEKVKVLDQADITSQFERVLRMQHAEGKIDRESLKLLLDAHEAEMMKERDEWERSSP